MQEGNLQAIDCLEERGHKVLMSPENSPAALEVIKNVLVSLSCWARLVEVVSCQ